MKIGMNTIYKMDVEESDQFSILKDIGYDLSKKAIAKREKSHVAIALIF